MKTTHTVRLSALFIIFLAFATEGRLYAQDWDFGDAPDPNYPTLLINNGARHAIGTLFMGAIIDSEPNGQPTPWADGDDNNPTQGDDEDGVQFNTTLISGVPGSVTVQCSGPGILQAWIDFNVDGDWNDPGEQILVNYSVSGGANVIPFSVPSFTVLGISVNTYARFRLSSQQGLGFAGPVGDGEVEDYTVTLYPLKWLQEPDLTDTGVDVDSDIELADDFLCTQTGPITDIHIWGSYLGDTEPEGLDPAQLSSLFFVLKIWSDVPADPAGGITYSHPGELLWESAFNPGQYQAGRAAFIHDGEWWHNPNMAPPDDWIPQADYSCYQYDFYIDPTNAFSQTTGTIYWLGIHITNNIGEKVFGWKSSTNHYNDDAVWRSDETSPWKELIYGDGHPFANYEYPSNSMDLAFAISTEEEYEHKMHWPQLPDPNGWDVRACSSPLTDQQPDGLRKVLADDFLCTSNGFINHITFWGSWFSNRFTNIEEHPYQGITNIHLSIHTDIPVDPPDIPYSRPGQLIRQYDIDPAAPPPDWVVLHPQEEKPSPQGWYDPNRPQGENWQTNNHDRYFRYEIFIPTNEAPEQFEGNIYWLDISVDTTNGLWGWKTSRSPHFNDDAVWTDMPVTNHQQWNELHCPTNEEVSLDLAFIIDEYETEIDWGDAPDQPYPTLNASMGANHTIVPGMYLGAGVDGEPDGQQHPQALGDDNDTVYPPANDDEDGVTFTPLVPGLPATITVTASKAGNLDAWIDYNGDGVWSTPGEKLTGGTIPLNAGANLIGITVPVGTTPVLSTFARFRYSSSAVALTPIGAAKDGEVEDYEVSIDDPVDWGDAPDPTYPTLAASVGAAHPIGGPYLGASVDPDLNGQPTPTANGDDTDPQGDDETGITFLTKIIPGAVAQANVVVGGATGIIDAWIDFDANGTWAPGEKIISSSPLPMGAYIAYIPIPTNAAPSTNTFARFRISTAGGLTPVGVAQDGEVEDYMVHIQDKKDIDWGDCPDTPYPTLAAKNGAHHVIVPGMFLGSQVDKEPNGLPSPNADGDDTNNLDDEDGVILTSALMPGGYATVNVIASQPGTLDAWLDFANNGSWLQPVDRIFAGEALSTGTNVLRFLVPLAAPTNSPAYARFRYSSGAGAYPGGVSYSGLAMNGEVEDYEYIITGVDEGYDFGDAPNSYQTLFASGGPRHNTLAGVMLGANIDIETNGIPDSAALGDDGDGIDDEDGVSFSGKIVAGSNATINVVAGASGGNLDAWIDYNRNGSFGNPGEHLFGGSSLWLSGGSTSIVVAVPAPPIYKPGPTFARFRISTAGGLGPGGIASDGEVEDYAIKLYQPIPSPDIVITNLFFTNAYTMAQVEWNSQSGITYQMQATTNLMASNGWFDVEATVLGPINWQTNSASIATTKIYRVTAPWTL